MACVAARIHQHLRFSAHVLGLRGSKASREKRCLLSMLNTILA